MNFVLNCNPGTQLIDVLRILIPTRPGVLDCRWEFRSLFAQIDYLGKCSANLTDSQVFPEFKESLESNWPFQLSGIRLVERTALVFRFEETELVRLSKESDDGIDIRIIIDSGIFTFECNDFELYDVVAEHYKLI